eukprot:scaffold1355_cov268-Pinguiococcus_pyrenoidosus.AAC.33
MKWMDVASRMHSINHATSQTTDLRAPGVRWRGREATYFWRGGRHCSQSPKQPACSSFSALLASRLILSIACRRMSKALHSPRPAPLLQGPARSIGKDGVSLRGCPQSRGSLI